MKKEFSVVSPADAIAELCFSTGDPGSDLINKILIDCVQQGYVTALRDDQGILRFMLSPVGNEGIRWGLCLSRFITGGGC